MLSHFLSLAALTALVHSLPVPVDTNSAHSLFARDRLVKRQSPYPYSYPNAYSGSANWYSQPNSSPGYSYTYPYSYPYTYTYPYGQPSTLTPLSQPQAPNPSPPPGFNPCADPNSVNAKVDCNGGEYAKTTVVNGGFSSVQESGHFTTWKTGNPSTPAFNPFTTLGTNSPSGNSESNNGNTSGSCTGGIDAFGQPCNGENGGSGGNGGSSTTIPFDNGVNNDNTNNGGNGMNNNQFDNGGNDNNNGNGGDGDNDNNNGNGGNGGNGDNDNDNGDGGNGGNGGNSTTTAPLAADLGVKVGGRSVVLT